MSVSSLVTCLLLEEHVLSGLEWDCILPFSLLQSPKSGTFYTEDRRPGTWPWDPPLPNPQLAKVTPCVPELWHLLPRAQRSTWKASSPLLLTPVTPWCARQGLSDWLVSPAHGLGQSTIPLWTCSIPLPLSVGHLHSILVHCVGCSPHPPTHGPRPGVRGLLPIHIASWMYLETRRKCHEDGACLCHAQPCPEPQARGWGPTHIAVTPDWPPHSAFLPSVIFRVFLLNYRQQHVTLRSKLPVASDHTQRGSQPPLGGLPCKAPVTLDRSRTLLSGSLCSRQMGPSFKGHCADDSFAQNVLS